MIRFDDERRSLSLSVRDLAEEGDYRFAGPAPLSLKRRALLGRLAHEDHQGAREIELSSYRRERGVRYETELEGWRVLVSGRIDGIYSDPQGRTVIEEVKTVVASERELAEVAEESFPAYARQLQLYRYLLEEGSAGLGFEGSAPEIALHLCLIALPSRATRTLDLSYDPAVCRELVQRRLRELLGEHALGRALEERRRAARDAIRFPHDPPRPSQEEMVTVIDEALEAGRDVLVSAPPGIGKTAAALVPALRHAWARGGRVFVATSKTTQQAIFAKTIGLLREAGTPVRAVVLTAREKACLNEVVACHEASCAYARGYAQKLQESGAVERLLAGGLADAPALRAEAEAHRFCPVEAAFDLTGEVDVIVGDYNYVFDPGATLKRMFIEGDPRDVVLVIDEAHNLYERGVAYYSAELRRERVQQLEQALMSATQPILRQVRGVAQRLLALLDGLEQGGGQPLPDPVEEEQTGPQSLFLFDDPQARELEQRRRQRGRKPKKARRTVPSAPPPPTTRQLAPEREVRVDPAPYAELRDAMGELAVAWFAEGRAGAIGDVREDPVLGFSRLLARFVGALELDGPEFSTIYRSEPQGGTLKVLCKDPSRQLARRLRACAGTVAVSATLEPLEFYRDVLGFRADARLASFPSPFDPSRRRILVLDRPSTTFQRRDRDLPIVEDAVRAVLAAHPGNHLVACPSFSYLEKLADRLAGLPGYELLRQSRYMNDASRAEVLDRLRRVRRAGDLPVALLVVQGGIFTEGVDYPGEDVVGAVVVGPGLPRVSFERKLIQEHFEQSYRRGFEYAFLFPAMSKVVQAAGRVIRTPTDRGVIALVGRRFATPAYQEHLPRDWYREHPAELISQDPYGELRTFWGE